MSDETIYEVRDRAAYITINRPEWRNALSRAVTASPVEHFSDASDEPDLRAVVITGTGDRAFAEKRKPVWRGR